MIKKNQIAIAGNIGVGKTTMTEKLANIFKLSPIYESVDDNPYLVDFYDDMKRWSFNLQIFFLYKRFSNQIELLSSENGFIQDRSLYEDKEIFARNLRDQPPSGVLTSALPTPDWPATTFPLNSPANNPSQVPPLISVAAIILL